MKIILSGFLAGVALFFFPLSTLSQATGGSLQGVVSDPNGAPIHGALIEIENEADSQGFSKKVSTSKTGYFLIPEIPSGYYKIKASKSGFRPSIITAQIYLSNRHVVELLLEPGNGTAVVDISPPTPLGLAPEIRSNQEAEAAKKLPQEPVFSSLLKSLSNLRQERSAGGLQAEGGSGSENTYFIDGQEVTNFRDGLLDNNNDLPFELIKEVEAKADAVSAEYSGALGATVNLATRGTNNNWRGSLGISFSPESWQGNPNAVLNRYGSGPGQIEYFKPNKDRGIGFFPYASFGGPVAKDRLWLFASYAPQVYSSRRNIDYFANGPNPSGRSIRESIRYKATAKTEVAFIRLDSQPTENFRIFATFLYNPVIQNGILPANSEGLVGVPQAQGGLSGADYLATRGGRKNSNLFTSQGQWDINKNLLLTVRGGTTFLNEKADSYGLARSTRFICNSAGNPSGVPGSNCFAGFQNVSSNFARDFEVSRRSTLEANGLLYGLNFFGYHSIKLGYQFNRLENEIKEGYTDTGIVQLFYGIGIDSFVPITPTPGNLGSGFLQRAGTIGEAGNSNQAVYLQDSWNLKNRLFLNFGLRLENEHLANYGRPTSNPGITPPASLPKFDGRFGWGEKAAPRFAAAFDLLGNGKSKLFGSYGKYYDRMKFLLFQSDTAPVFYRDFFEILPSRGAAYTNYTFARILGSNTDNPLGNCPIANSSGWSVCQFSFSTTSNLPPTDFALPRYDPGLKPSAVKEFSVGIEQRFGNGFILSGRYISRALSRIIEDISAFNSQGSESFFYGNPGRGLHCKVAASASLPCPEAERNYKAFEAVFDKRGGDYFLNASYTFSRLFGNYSGLASSDEFGRATPNISRSFDLPAAGFNANGQSDNGRLATDRPHVFKAFGGYSFNWLEGGRSRTSISAFTTIQSGTPLTTTYSLYGNTSSILFGRGDLGRTGTFSETDLMISHRSAFGGERVFLVEPYFIFLNLFDERNELLRQTSISATNFTASSLSQGGCTACLSQAAVYQVIHNGGGIGNYVSNYLNARGVSATGIRNDYNLPRLFQAPRSLRFGFRFSF